MSDNKFPINPKPIFSMGDIVKHRLYPFRGVIVDVDPEFSNTEENIKQVSKILDKKNIKSIIFICSPYLSKRSKLVWKKNAKSLEIFVKKTIDWPSDRNFFDKVYDKKTILYEMLAISYYKLKGKI